MKSFVVYGAIAGFLSGIFSRSLLQFGLPEIIWILVLSFCIALIWRRRSSTSSAPYLICVSIFLLLFSFGALRMEYAISNEINVVFENSLGISVTKEGTIVREPEMKTNSTHLYVQTEDELLLVVTRGYTTFEYGDHVSFKGTVEKPETFETELGRTFNYPGYLHARGVTYVVSFAEVALIGREQGNRVVSSLLSFKHEFMRKIEAAIPAPHAGLAEGLLLGVKRALGSTYEDAFRTTGITHIVVLSGYNITLVTLFILYVSAFFLPYKPRLLFGIVAIAAFALLVGLSATVVRASVMAVFALIAKLTGRIYDVIRALLLAGTIMLLFNPYLLVYDVGFQLSFMATLGLILLADPLEKYFACMPKTIGLRGFLVATVAAQIFVMPILLYQIGQLSVVSVVVNLLVLPMVPIAMLLSFITGVAGFVSLFISQLFGYLAYWSLTYILTMATFFASLPFASLSVPSFPFVFVVAAYVLLFVGVFFIRRPIVSKETNLIGGTITTPEMSIQKMDPKTYVQLSLDELYKK